MQYLKLFWDPLNHIAKQWRKYTRNRFLFTWLTGFMTLAHEMFNVQPTKVPPEVKAHVGSEKVLGFLEWLYFLRVLIQIHISLSHYGICSAYHWRLEEPIAHHLLEADQLSERMRWAPRLLIRHHYPLLWSFSPLPCGRDHYSPEGLLNKTKWLSSYWTVLKGPVRLTLPNVGPLLLSIVLLITRAFLPAHTVA